MSKINLDEILPFVSKPTRYIGQELNAVSEDKWITSDDKKLIKIVLAFPDVYEIGMSNLGAKILYEIINKRDDALAERVYSPWTDLEDILRKKDIPLFSLESKKSLREFDVIGFSLHYELSYTNVLNILNLANIPLRSVERDEKYPLIIAGGPCCFNPEPLADFIDLFVLGDGEEIIGEIIDIYKNYKCKNSNNEIRNKMELLKEMSKLEGIYVPSFYEVKYNKDKTIAGVKPKFNGVPERIKKRSVNLNKAEYPVKPVVPYMHVVHNRLLLEIMRGCGRGCRFCQAGIIYRPVRKRNVDSLVDLAKEGIRNTGYGEISLASLSSTDYPEIEKLIFTLEKELKPKKISISLPSLRPDNFSLNLAMNMARIKKSGLTFAPEAGTQRLRNVINKKITDQDIITTIGKAYSSGWKLVKLYFMFGLPTETKDDIEGIIRLVKKIKFLYQKLNVNITVSAFIPKPHTPFQWTGQESMKSLNNKKEYLLKNLPGSKKWHKITTSFLEAVFARGDRRLSDVLERAWQKGCKFDEWDEHFKFDLWMQAFEESKIDPCFYSEREKKSTEILPWDHFDCGVDKKFLLSEYEKSFSGDVVNNYSVLKTEKEPVKNINSDVHSQVTASQMSAVQRLRVRYSKGDNLRFISHLELVTTIIRALQRMDAPLVYSEGFTPRPKISLGPALSVGVSSEDEYFDLQLGKKCKIDNFITTLNNHLPSGIEILHVQEIALNDSSLINVIDYADYEVINFSSLAAYSYGVEAGNKKYNWQNINEKEVQDKINKFLSAKEIIVDKQIKNGIRKIDIRGIILGVKIKKSVSKEISLLVSLKINSAQSIRPDVVIKKIFNLSDSDTKILNIKRVKLGIKKYNNPITQLM